MKGWKDQNSSLWNTLFFFQRKIQISKYIYLYTFIRLIYDSPLQESRHHSNSILLHQGTGTMRPGGNILRHLTHTHWHFRERCVMKGGSKRLSHLGAWLAQDVHSRQTSLTVLLNILQVSSEAIGVTPMETTPTISHRFCLHDKAKSDGGWSKILFCSLSHKIIKLVIHIGGCKSQHIRVLFHIDSMQDIISQK